MAKPRVFTHPDTQAGVYHLVSRVVDRNFIFGDAEKWQKQEDMAKARVAKARGQAS